MEGLEKKMKKQLLSIIIFLFVGNAFADSASVGNIKYDEAWGYNKKDCYAGNVSVDIAYELTSKGSSNLCAMGHKYGDNNNVMSSFACTVVARGAGVVTVSGVPKKCHEISFADFY